DSQPTFRCALPDAAISADAGRSAGSLLARCAPAFASFGDTTNVWTISRVKEFGAIVPFVSTWILQPRSLSVPHSSRHPIRSWWSNGSPPVRTTSVAGGIRASTSATGVFWISFHRSNRRPSHVYGEAHHEHDRSHPPIRTNQATRPASGP